MTSATVTRPPKYACKDCGKAVSGPDKERCIVCHLEWKRSPEGRRQATEWQLNARQKERDANGPACKDCGGRVSIGSGGKPSDRCAECRLAWRRSPEGRAATSAQRRASFEARKEFEASIEIRVETTLQPATPVLYALPLRDGVCQNCGVTATVCPSCNALRCACACPWLTTHRQHYTPDGEPYRKTVLADELYRDAISTERVYGGDSW